MVACFGNLQSTPPTASRFGTQAKKPRPPHPADLLSPEEYASIQDHAATALGFLSTFYERANTDGDGAPVRVDEEVAAVTLSPNEAEAVINAVQALFMYMTVTRSGQTQIELHALLLGFLAELFGAVSDDALVALFGRLEREAAQPDLMVLFSALNTTQTSVAGAFIDSYVAKGAPEGSSPEDARRVAGTFRLHLGQEYEVPVYLEGVALGRFYFSGSASAIQVGLRGIGCRRLRAWVAW